MNYNVIALLDDRLDSDMRVFEYGSGFSTLYFAERVSSVVSVEYDQQWIEKLSTNLPSNVEYDIPCAG
jgi:16S rRNA A1518/A1519 N6-dimethyltransferase RsmA/KsgA/DIM1 with predicted DNA glycosylase/AP lyase activity